MISFIQRYLIYILLAAIAVLFVIAGIQYVRFLKADSKVSEQKKEIASLNDKILTQNAIIESYKKTIVEAKEVQKKLQKQTDETAHQWAKLNELKTKCILEASDEKIISDFTYYFNSGGVRRESNPDGEILPEAGSPDTDRPRWTLKQLAENYLNLIDYTLKLETTVECYEKK